MLRQMPPWQAHLACSNIVLIQILIDSKTNIDTSKSGKLVEHALLHTAYACQQKLYLHGSRHPTKPASQLAKPLNWNKGYQEKTTVLEKFPMPLGGVEITPFEDMRVCLSI